MPLPAENLHNTLSPWQGGRECTFLMVNLKLRGRKTFAKTPCPLNLSTLETRRVLCNTVHPPDRDRTWNKKNVHTALVSTVFHCCETARGEPPLKFCPPTLAKTQGKHLKAATAEPSRPFSKHNYGSWFSSHTQGKANLWNRASIPLNAQSHFWNVKTYI